VKLVTLNGAYNWALANGLTPSATVVVDGRAFNSRFVYPVIPECKYFIASQVDPSVLEGLPKDRTYLWHTNVNVIKDILDARYENWWNTPGGSTVFLRSIPLLRMLGFKRFHIFGVDSCMIETPDKSGLIHHAYAQPENDDSVEIPVTCGNRVFKCMPWMVAQAQEFMDLIKFLGDEMELEVYGDGLLAHILKTGAHVDTIMGGFSPDECQVVYEVPGNTSGAGAKLWLGNRVGQATFEGEILCVLEEPHCPKNPRSTHIHILQDGQAKRELLMQAARHINKVLWSGKDLLVHCGAGMERSPLTIAWWMFTTGIASSMAQAYDILQAARPIVANRENWIEKSSTS
jgi:hypothetical protein